MRSNTQNKLGCGGILLIVLIALALGFAWTALLAWIMSSIITSLSFWQWFGIIFVLSAIFGGGTAGAVRN